MTPHASYIDRRYHVEIRTERINAKKRHGDDILNSHGGWQNLLKWCSSQVGLRKVDDLNCFELGFPYRLISGESFQLNIGNLDPSSHHDSETIEGPEDLTQSQHPFVRLLCLSAMLPQLLKPGCILSHHLLLHFLRTQSSLDFLSHAVSE